MRARTSPGHDPEGSPNATRLLEFISREGPKKSRLAAVVDPGLAKNNFEVISREMRQNKKLGRGNELGRHVESPPRAPRCSNFFFSCPFHVK